MDQPEQFTVVAIPLSRPEVVDFLLPPAPEPAGAPLHIIGQRPTAQTEAAWIEQLQTAARPTLADLLAIDDPHAYLVPSHTDRLVPTEFLAEPKFLTRNLGGWAPILLGTVGLPGDWPADPLLGQAEILAEYGPDIRYFGTDPNLVSARLAQETGASVDDLAAGLIRLHQWRSRLAADRPAYIERLYEEIATGRYFGQNGQPPLPNMLLFDELLGQMVRLELAHRAAVARADQATAESIQGWQQRQQETSGLFLILKGEYIMGRHRRSTVLIAPELGVVIKQPGPEPFHEVELEARQANGQAENWPYLTRNGAMVTPRGRLRLVVEEDLVPRLNRIFDHQVRFSTLLGLIVEPFVTGPTTQELILADASALTPELYELYVLHQQVCEVLHIENGDWHSANFVVRAKDGTLVHVDWGAARPLEPHELTPESRRARLNQVRNLAYSFHDEALAERVLALHAKLVADEERLARLHARARELAGRTN